METTPNITPTLNADKPFDFQDIDQQIRDALSNLTTLNHQVCDMFCLMSLERKRLIALFAKVNTELEKQNVQHNTK